MGLITGKTPLDIVVQNIISGSYLTNSDFSMFNVAEWQKDGIVAPGTSYPLIAANTVVAEWDDSRVYAELLIDILFKYPEADICKDPSQILNRNRIIQYSQQYVRHLFEISQWLTGTLKLPNGNCIADYNLDGRARVDIYYGGYLEYEQKVLRGRGAEDILPDDLIIIEMRLPVWGSFEYICCPIFTPTEEEVCIS